MPARVRAAFSPPDGSVLVLFVALTVLLFRRGWSGPTSRWIGAAGDPPTYMWFLKWTPWALGRGDNPLFTRHVNFPDGVNMMWNNFEPLVGLAASPFTFLFGIVFSYNVVLTLGVALSGWCAYLFLRRHTEHEAAAVIGGLLYGFSPFVMSHALTHLNLVQLYILPLMVMAAEEIVVHQRRPVWVSGGVLGVLVAAQLLIGEEYLVYEVFALAIGTLVLAAAHWREVRSRAPYVLRSVGAGVVVALLIAGGPLAYQFFGPGRATHGILHPIEALSADLLAFVVPTELQQVNPPWTKDVTSKFTDACCLEEQGSYLGVPLLLLLVVAATRWWGRDIVKVATVVGVIFLVLSMGPHLHIAGTVTPMSLPFRALQSVPVIGNIIPRRLVLLTWLGAGVLVALWADAVLRRGRHQVAAVAGGVALLVALVPLVPTLRYPATTAVVPDFFTSAAVERIPRDSVALVAPFSRDTNTSAPMLWQAEADYRYKMPEGYILGADEDGRFNFLPSASVISKAMEDIQNGGQAPALTADVRAQIERELAERRVESVIVGPLTQRAAMVAFFTELLDRPPERIAGVELWRDVGRSRDAG